MKKVTQPVDWLNNLCKNMRVNKRMTPMTATRHQVRRLGHYALLVIQVVITTAFLIGACVIVGAASIIE